jgi:hypothetical protein
VPRCRRAPTHLTHPAARKNKEKENARRPVPPKRRRACSRAPSRLTEACPHPAHRPPRRSRVLSAGAPLTSSGGEQRGVRPLADLLRLLVGGGLGLLEQSLRRTAGRTANKKARVVDHAEGDARIQRRGGRGRRSVRRAASVRTLRYSLCGLCRATVLRPRAPSDEPRSPTTPAAAAAEQTPQTEHRRRTAWDVRRADASKVACSAASVARDVSAYRVRPRRSSCRSRCPPQPAVSARERPSRTARTRPTCRQRANPAALPCTPRRCPH